MFSIGDFVEHIDENLKGKIISKKGNTLSIVSSDGFQFEVESHRVIKYNSSLLNVSLHNVEKAKMEKESDYSFRKKISIPPKNKILEVDLHIHQIIDNTQNISNYEMLMLQINITKQKMDYAIRHRISKVVFIHGIGEGILKSMLLDYLHKLDYVDYYDADYKTYGQGATEVVIYFSKITF